MAAKGKFGSRRKGSTRKPASGNKLKDVIAKNKAAAERKEKYRRLAELRKKQATRKQANASRPVPKSRRASNKTTSGRQAVTRSREVSDELRSKLTMLESTYERVDREAELGDVYDAMGEVENMLTNLPLKLNQLRGRGYVHSAHLEEELVVLDDKWDDIRPTVEERLKENLDRLDDEMDDLERDYNRLQSSPSESLYERVESAIDRMESSVNTVENNIESLFQGIWDSLDEIEGAVELAEWMIGKIDGAPDIQLYEAEGPLLAVEAEWEEDGEDEGPDGILYLTDQRLLFEQNEEIAKKKFLFITTDKEKVQKLLLDIPAMEIQNVEHREEGRGMLGMRKDDILEFVFSGNAPISRARFHLKGQDSSDWAAMIKLVRSGEIDGLRGDEFVEEMEAAAAATASLPAQCPNCYADVPPQPRGVLSYTCEFCHAVIEAGT